MNTHIHTSSLNVLCSSWKNVTLATFANGYSRGISGQIKTISFFFVPRGRIYLTAGECPSSNEGQVSLIKQTLLTKRYTTSHWEATSVCFSLHSLHFVYYSCVFSLSIIKQILVHLKKNSRSVGLLIQNEFSKYLGTNRLEDWIIDPCGMMMWERDKVCVCCNSKTRWSWCSN